MPLVAKVTLGYHTRRIYFNRRQVRALDWATLHKKIFEVFQTKSRTLNPENFRVTYEDDECDQITLATDSELCEALHHTTVKNGAKFLYLTVVPRYDSDNSIGTASSSVESDKMFSSVSLSDSMYLETVTGSHMSAVSLTSTVPELDVSPPLHPQYHQQQQDHAEPDIPSSSSHTSPPSPTSQDQISSPTSQDHLSSPTQYTEFKQLSKNLTATKYESDCEEKSFLSDDENGEVLPRDMQTSTLSFTQSSCREMKSTGSQTDSVIVIPCQSLQNLSGELSQLIIQDLRQLGVRNLVSDSDPAAVAVAGSHSSGYPSEMAGSTGWAAGIPDGSDYTDQMAESVGFASASSAAAGGGGGVTQGSDWHGSMAESVGFAPHILTSCSDFSTTSSSSLPPATTTSTSTTASTTTAASVSVVAAPPSNLDLSRSIADLSDQITLLRQTFAQNQPSMPPSQSSVKDTGTTPRGPPETETSSEVATGEGNMQYSSIGDGATGSSAGSSVTGWTATGSAFDQGVEAAPNPSVNSSSDINQSLGSEPELEPASEPGASYSICPNMDLRTPADFKKTASSSPNDAFNDSNPHLAAVKSAQMFQSCDDISRWKKGADVSSQSDYDTEQKLAFLQSIGFTNEAFNRVLLQQNNDDLDLTVTDLKTFYNKI